MNPEFRRYKVGDLVVVTADPGVGGLITRPNYWTPHEFLGGEIECVDVLFGAHESKEYPVEYLASPKRT